MKGSINGALFQLAEPISGVPQGSVIGPILFVIYVNDLPDRLSADSLLYAGEVKLIASLNHHDILQKFLNIRASWSRDWELDLNATKSEHLPIGKSPHLSLTPSRPITHQTPRTYLQSPPSVLNARLSADDYVVNAANKVRRMLFCLE